jgi:RNA polymerase sigma-70 factor (ECF subfamily)
MADERAELDIAQLVAEHHRAVYAYAFRLSGSAPDAEDLAQHVFLIAQQRLGQLRNPACVRGWLLTILRNRFLKTSQRQQPLPASSVGLNLDAIPMAAVKEEMIDRGRLQEALNQLSPEFRVVLAMFYFEDCSYREIAEQLDMPIGTVMSRLARAKRCLRARLFEPEPAPAGPPVRRPHSSVTR